MEKEKEDKRIEVTKMNNKIRRVLASWMGLSSEDVFQRWKYVTKKEKWRRRKDEIERIKQARLKYESELAKYQIANEEVRLSAANQLKFLIQ